MHCINMVENDSPNHMIHTRNSRHFLNLFHFPGFSFLFSCGSPPFSAKLENGDLNCSRRYPSSLYSICRSFSLRSSSSTWWPRRASRRISRECCSLRLTLCTCLLIITNKLLSWHLSSNRRRFLAMFKQYFCRLLIDLLHASPRFSARSTLPDCLRLRSKQQRFVSLNLVEIPKNVSFVAPTAHLFEKPQTFEHGTHSRLQRSHTSHLTHHTSHFTFHTSHFTLHTSHFKHKTPPSNGSP